MAVPMVLLVGSSGGGRGHVGTPQELIAAVRKNLASRGMHLAEVQFTCCSVGLDSAASSDRAVLHVDGSRATERFHGTLHEVNSRAADNDGRLAERVARGEIAGLITVSCDPNGVNSRVLRAAAAAGVPVVGTGGASVAVMTTLGCTVLPSSGGSVATAPECKAIVFASALAGAIPSAHVVGGDMSVSVRLARMATPHSVLAGTLPIFLTLAVTRQLRDASWLAAIGGPLSEFAWLPTSGDNALPVATAAVGATVWAVCPPLELLAATAATAAVVKNRSIVAALMAAAAAAITVPTVLSRVAQAGLPSTPASIVACGAALLAACMAASMAASAAALTTATIRWAIVTVILSPDSMLQRGIAGAIAGMLTYVGASRGMYHRVVLPLLLIEMELAPERFAFFGALDLCCLCMTAAGVCLAAWLTPGHTRFSEGDRRLGKFGALQTLLVGDFVESAEPFVARAPVAWWASVAASAAGGAVLAAADCHSTAYLPLPAAIGLGECRSPDLDGYGSQGPLFAAAALCMGVPFVAVALGSPAAKAAT